MSKEPPFSQQIPGVTPLPPSDRVSPNIPVKPEPTLAQLARRQAAEAFLPVEGNNLSTTLYEFLLPTDVLNFKREGVQEGVFRKLRLGQYPIEARLDLHHMTVEDARKEVFQFIQDCVRYELRTVLILHGKGERSHPQQAKLKSYVNFWLPQIHEVLAFHSAQQHHGGLGAVYIMLRKSTRESDDNRERFARR